MKSIRKKIAIVKASLVLFLSALPIVNGEKAETIVLPDDVTTEPKKVPADEVFVGNNDPFLEDLLNKMEEKVHSTDDGLGM